MATNSTTEKVCGPPLIYGQQILGSSSEDNTGQNMDKGY
jgi:hypothetical protein